ncbi:T9SS type A sorting domain-containing protein [Lacinutrix chionoecetis]
MKKIYTLLFLVFTIVTYSQSSDYKTAATKKGSNYFDIVNQTRQEFKKLKESNQFEKAQQKAQKHFERWAFYWRDRVDAAGNFPSELQGYYNAGIIDSKGKLKTAEDISANKSGVTNQQWTNIGPQTVPDANGYPNNPQMGRLTNFLRYEHATDANQNVLFVSAPVGGVWKSTDNGVTWTPKLDFIAGIGVTDIKSSATDINNPGTIYVSTGDYDAAHIKSIGVLKSTDFGETYQSTGLTFSLEDQESLSNLIVIDANTVIVGTNKFIKKTTDGGATWNNVFAHNYNDAVIGKFHRNGTNIMACDSWGGLLFSSNNGTTWTQLIPEGTNPERHASTSNQAGVFYIQNKAGQVFTYNPSATTPTLTAIGIPTTNYKPQGEYNQAIAVKNGLIISGGVDAINSEDNGAVWYTTLNNAWESNSDEGSYGHADIHEMGTLDAGYSFWTVNDGGLTFVTYPSISTEKPTVDYKSSGVLVTQLYSVAISPQSEDHIIMGNQDNDGYSQETVNGTLKWVSGRVGDGTCTAIDYNDSGVRYLGAQNGGLIRVDNGFAGNLDGTPVLDADSGPAAGAPFVWTLKMNSTIPNTLYAGLADVYKTSNKGTSWTNLNSGAGQIEYIETFGSNLLVIGTNSIQKSNNDGVTWAPITQPDATAKMNSISLDQNNTNTVYATVRGYNDGSKVYKSINGGVNWTNISSGLPNIKMTQVVLKQNQGEEILFAGTEIGVYYKVGTEAWAKLGEGLPNVNVSDIEINYTADKLVAGTFGRGLWNISIDNNTLGINEVPTIANQAPYIYPNPITDGNLNIKLSKSNSEFNYVIYNVIGGLIRKGKLMIGNNTIDVNNVAAGIYIIRMTDGKTVSSQKIIIK